MNCRYRFRPNRLRARLTEAETRPVRTPQTPGQESGGRPANKPPEFGGTKLRSILVLTLADARICNFLPILMLFLSPAPASVPVFIYSSAE
jgi:hypothetical protein